MKAWFDEFHNALFDGSIPTDLIGAGEANAEEALAHYRYQHEVKIRESVESTLPALVRHLNVEWNEVWKIFRALHTPSPRSLDWYPQVFLNYYLASTAPLHLKELARFEQAMDQHPWTHSKLLPEAIEAMDSDCRLILSPLDVHRFKAPVVKLYRGEEPGTLDTPQDVLIWMREDGVHFRVMQGWELKVLENASRSIGEALEHAPEDTGGVSEFFTWLGKSSIIRQVITLSRENEEKV